MARNGCKSGRSYRKKTTPRKRCDPYLFSSQHVDFCGFSPTFRNHLGHWKSGCVSSHPGLFSSRSRRCGRHGGRFGGTRRIFLPHHFWLSFGMDRTLDELLDVYAFHFCDLLGVDASCGSSPHEEKRSKSSPTNGRKFWRGVKKAWLSTFKIGTSKIKRFGTLKGKRSPFEI